MEQLHPPLLNYIRNAGKLPSLAYKTLATTLVEDGFASALTNPPPKQVEQSNQNFNFNLINNSNQTEIEDGPAQP